MPFQKIGKNKYSKQPAKKMSYFQAKMKAKKKQKLSPAPSAQVAVPTNKETWSYSDNPIMARRYLDQNFGRTAPVPEEMGNPKTMLEPMAGGTNVKTNRSKARPNRKRVKVSGGVHKKNKGAKRVGK